MWWDASSVAWVRFPERARSRYIDLEKINFIIAYVVVFFLIRLLYRFLCLITTWAEFLLTRIRIFNHFIIRANNIADLDGYKRRRINLRFSSLYSNETPLTIWGLVRESSKQRNSERNWCKNIKNRKIYLKLKQQQICQLYSFNKVHPIT